MGEPGHSLRMAALFPPPVPATERGKLLWQCHRTRALMSWIKPGAYAWWTFKGDLKAQQRRLLEYRRRPAPDEVPP